MPRCGLIRYAVINEGQDVVGGSAPLGLVGAELVQSLGVDSEYGGGVILYRLEVSDESGLATRQWRFALALDILGDGTPTTQDLFGHKLFLVHRRERIHVQRLLLRRWRHDVDLRRGCKMGQNAMPIFCQPMLAEELDVVVMLSLIHI